MDCGRKQPHKGFNRKIGEFAGACITPDGEVVSAEVFDSMKGNWLCDADDHAFIDSLMKANYEPGKYASWIAPPRVGINNRPGDFEYVKLHDC